MKEGLELSVARLLESDSDLYKQALDYMCSEIRSSTSSMTSVPKPLKFLRPHYESLKNVYESWPPSQEMKPFMADMLSVLAMTMAEANSRECLKYRLAGTKSDVSSWGHEYIRSLAGEIAIEYNQRVARDGVEQAQIQELSDLVTDILPFQMQHNAEAEAVDLLLEVNQLRRLLDTPSVDDRNFERVCLYLLRCADFIADPDELNELLSVAFELYRLHGKYPDALRVALKCDDEGKINELFYEQPHPSDVIKRQMCLILARHRSTYTTDNDSLNELIGNLQISDYFRSVARGLDLMEPKTPEDIYKTHLAEGSGNYRARSSGGLNAVTDSHKVNLAASFVNAFVNTGFGKDKMITSEKDGNWIYKFKDSGMMSGVAAIGLISLWESDEALTILDNYFHHKEENVRAGACLGLGVAASGVRNEADPALALLTEYITNKSFAIRCATICGLGIAYAGQQREEVMEILLPIVSNTEDANMTEVSLAALCIGLVYVATCNEDAGGAIVQRLMEATETELNHYAIRFLCLGLGLLFLGKSERAEAMLEAVKTVEHRISKYACLTLETCAYAGTGNVLIIQRMLMVCAETPSDGSDHQAVAVLGIAMSALGEDIGTEMCQRTFDHLLQYGCPKVRRVVPLAVALLFVSNPDYGVIDQLSRLSHDTDPELAQGAIFGLGLVSAGTNNSRVAGLLRQLSDFYSKESTGDHLFMVRIAQGLNSLAKGLIGLSPFHSDR